jgi:hypothetical protein
MLQVNSQKQPLEIGFQILLPYSSIKGVILVFVLYVKHIAQKFVVIFYGLLVCLWIIMLQVIQVKYV